jgi:hypothetical protein
MNTNVNTLDEMIAVIQAYKDGKTIQFRYGKGENWAICTLQHLFNFSDFVYRIKPEPRVVYVNLYSDSHTAYNSSERAKDSAAFTCLEKAVKFVEVLE